MGFFYVKRMFIHICILSNNAYSEALNCTCIWHNMCRLKCFEVPVKLDLAIKESRALIICTLKLSYHAVGLKTSHTPPALSDPHV